MGAAAVYLPADMDETKIWMVMKVDGELLMRATAIRHIPRAGEQLNLRDLGMCNVLQVMHAERSPIGDIALYLEQTSPIEANLPIRPAGLVRMNAEEMRESGWRDFQRQWWAGKVDTSV